LDKAGKRIRANPKRARATPVPWPRQEELALIEYITVHGASWAAILHHDRRTARRLDVRRTQGGLKDKARILKYRFLVAGKALPQNFKGVTLGAALEAKIARLKS
jgi:hypothetical protein